MKYLELHVIKLRLMVGSLVILAGAITAPKAIAEEVLIACQYNEKWYMSIVNTDHAGIQRVFGHDAYVTEHNKGFLRVRIVMEASISDLIFSGRSGAMSYDSGEIDPDVSCRLERLRPPEQRVPQGRHDYLWYFNDFGVERSYTTTTPTPRE